MYATSFALNGLPSLQFAPLRTVNVSVLKPFVQCDDVASMGTGGLPLWRMFTNSSDSYTGAKVMPGPRTAELNGLNWQVQVEPLTLSMTSLPPILPVLAPVEDEPDELPPQAVASRQAAASGTSQLKRFIDTLRSPLDDRPPEGGRSFPDTITRYAIWEIPKQKGL